MGIEKAIAAVTADSIARTAAIPSVTETATALETIAIEGKWWDECIAGSIFEISSKSI